MAACHPFFGGNPPPTHFPTPGKNRTNDSKPLLFSLILAQGLGWLRVALDHVCLFIICVQHENGNNRLNLAKSRFEVAQIGSILTRNCVQNTYVPPLFSYEHLYIFISPSVLTLAS